MKNILYITSNAIHVYAIYVFIEAFLGKSHLGPVLKNLIYILYFFIGTFFWMYAQSSMLNLILNTLPIFLITFQYYAPLSRKLFSVIFSCAIGMFIDWIAFAVFGDVEIIKSGFIQCIFLLMLASSFKHYYKIKDKYPFKSKYSWFLILTSIGTGLIGVMTVDEKSSNDYLIATILLLINFLNFYVYNLEQHSLETQHKLRLIETSNHAYQNQIHIMNESQKKLKFIRHDLRNHLNRIRILVNNENFQAIPDYLDEMEEAVIVKREYSKTGNNDVDSLINYELTLASELGTEIVCDIDLPEQLNVSSFDMTVILGNLLDNAVEALRQSKRKVLIITIKFMKGIIRIDIENSYNSKYRRNPDGREHGIGLLSVTNTLEKYHGNMKIFSDGEKYHTTVVLFNSLD